jgi:hypothetical protein
MLVVRRRTYHQIKAVNSNCRFHVYVVLLDLEAAKDPHLLKSNPKRQEGMPCVYVGLTGLTPEERFANHKRGYKAADVVQRHGIRLVPELYEWLNPMPFAAASQMERDLAEDLRGQGYTVAGGH